MTKRVPSSYQSQEQFFKALSNNELIAYLKHRDPGTRRQASAELGRRGGRSRSLRKGETARENGTLGGRPKKPTQ